LVHDEIQRIVRAALDEDIGQGDLTTTATVAESATARGRFLAKQDCVLAGLECVQAAFSLMDPACRLTLNRKDGERAASGETFAVIHGRARALLSAERVALNFLQRLSGVATLTRRFVEAVAGTPAQIRDTRKTTPLLRVLEKRAVTVGGGTPHRSGLDTGVLIKENHIHLAGSIAEAVRRARGSAPGLVLEVEVERADQIESALEMGAEMLLLDNFTPEAVRLAVQQIAGRVPVEVSGGVTLESVRSYAEAGPDYIAVGALTHSAPAIDISLEIDG
jgi:nicotinate-nucleotide pyrophosphorylase (carboxylating)